MVISAHSEHKNACEAGIVDYDVDLWYNNFTKE